MVSTAYTQQARMLLLPRDSVEAVLITIVERVDERTKEESIGGPPLLEARLRFCTCDGDSMGRWTRLEFCMHRPAQTCPRDACGNDPFVSILDNPGLLGWYLDSLDCWKTRLGLNYIAVTIPEGRRDASDRGKWAIPETLLGRGLYKYRNCRLQRRPRILWSRYHAGFEAKLVGEETRRV